MSRYGSILLLVAIVGFFGAAATRAQAALQGPSQYGGLRRNLNLLKCIDVVGSSTDKQGRATQHFRAYTVLRRIRNESDQADLAEVVSRRRSGRDCVLRT
jgi:hypothetical protein